MKAVTGPIRWARFVPHSRFTSSRCQPRLRPFPPSNPLPNPKFCSYKQYLNTVAGKDNTYVAAAAQDGDGKCAPLEEGIPDLSRETETEISLDEFIASLSMTLCRNVAHDGVGGPVVIALSGGVDSIVLTDLLYRTFTAPAPLSRSSSAADDPLFYAGIIDHGARKASAAEAKSVAAYIRTQYGSAVDVRVQRLGFLDATKSRGRIAGFEQRAREERYKALGQICFDALFRRSGPGSRDSLACASSGPAYLFTAHHASDQAEEMLMRLARYNISLFTFQGISSKSDIPCCAGLWGISQSGGDLRFPQSRRLSNYSTESYPSLSTEDGNTQSASPFLSAPFLPVVPLESGGVSVIRPLLPFSKARILATAQARGLWYVTDETNKDVTYTLRNAARWLLSPDSSTPIQAGVENCLEKKPLLAPALLPRALQASSLLSLNAVSKRRKHIYQLRALEILRSKCHILLFLPSVGSLSIRFSGSLRNPLDPGTHSVRVGTRESECSSSLSFSWTAIEATLLLRMLIRVVSPVSKIETTELRSVARQIFGFQNPSSHPSSLSSECHDRNVPRPATPFTFAGILFVPHTHSARSCVDAKSNGFESSCAQWVDTWTLVRAPPSRRELAGVKLPLPLSIDSTHSSKDTNNLKHSFDGPQSSLPLALHSPDPRFQLFDSRFWLRASASVSPRSTPGPTSASRTLPKSITAITTAIINNLSVQARFLVPDDIQSLFKECRSSLKSGDPISPADGANHGPDSFPNSFREMIHNLTRLYSQFGTSSPSESASASAAAGLPIPNPLAPHPPPTNRHSIVLRDALLRSMPGIFLSFSPCSPSFALPTSTSASSLFSFCQAHGWTAHVVTGTGSGAHTAAGKNAEAGYPQPPPGQDKRFSSPSTLSEKSQPASAFPFAIPGIGWTNPNPPLRFFLRPNAQHYNKSDNYGAKRLRDRDCVAGLKKSDHIHEAQQEYEEVRIGIRAEMVEYRPDRSHHLYHRDVATQTLFTSDPQSPRPGPVSGGVVADGEDGDPPGRTVPQRCTNSRLNGPDISITTATTDARTIQKDGGVDGKSVDIDIVIKLEMRYRAVDPEVIPSFASSLSSSILQKFYSITNLHIHQEQGK